VNVSGRIVAVVLVVVVGLVLGVAWWTLEVDQQLVLHLELRDVILFAAAAAVMELLPIRLADGRALPTSLAVVGAATLLGGSPVVVALIAVTAYVASCLISRRPPAVLEVV
jgi:hypothetical protein